MMFFARSIWLVLSALFMGSGASVAQSFLDSDFYCRTYGCVIVHDGFTYDVYDNYNFATGGSVPPGGRMIAWSGNPFQGSGLVNPVVTGTRTEGFHTIPLQDEGVRFAIDQDGDGAIDLSTAGNQRGFLDASGVFQPFQLSGASRLGTVDETSRRSFYLSSRTDFYLAAQARVLGDISEFSNSTRLADVAFLYGVTRSGTDDGMRFGSRTRNGNYIRPLNNVDDLADISTPGTYILEFRNAIRRQSSPSLPEQSVRFDYTYGFEDYDLSMGAGDLRYQIEFTFYNR